MVLQSIILKHNSKYLKFGRTEIISKFSFIVLKLSIWLKTSSLFIKINERNHLFCSKKKTCRELALIYTRFSKNSIYFSFFVSKLEAIIPSYISLQKKTRRDILSSFLLNSPYINKVELTQHLLHV